jgi:hypothetical protein
MMAAIVIGLFFILAGQKPVGKGLILGTFFSVANFILIGQILPMRLNKSKMRNMGLSLLSILFRYSLLATPLVVAIKFEQFNLIGAIVGLFMVQLVILGEHLIKIVGPSQNQKT